MGAGRVGRKWNNGAYPGDGFFVGNLHSTPPHIPQYEETTQQHEENTETEEN